MDRKVPVPRRIIRHLAGASSRAMVATVFAHLIRCLRYRRGQCVSGGFCKASWVSQVFGVHPRSVKAARKRLIELGWLRKAACPQWVLNGLGMGTEIGLQWVDAARPPDVESPPPIGRPDTGTPPPMKNVKLSVRPEMQNLAVATPAGCSSRTVAHRASPKLTNIVSEDLGNERRLAALFEQAVRRGWVTECGSDRLNFWAAAEHARSAGSRNMPGLFVWVVKHRRWGFITQRDEDAARDRLARAGARQRKQVPPGVSRETWSSAATVCASVLGRLSSLGLDARGAPQP